MYLEYPHNTSKELLKKQIDKNVSKLNKLEFYSGFKISELHKNWNNSEMIFTLNLKQSFLERRIKGVLQIKDEVIIIEFEVPDIIKNFVREEKLNSIISKHLDNIVEEINYAVSNNVIQ
jgi:hypothetical protein